MKKKLFTIAIVRLVLASLVLGFYILGLLKLSGLENDGTLGYYAVLSGPVIVSLLSVFHIVRSVLIIKKQLRLRRELIIEAEVAKRTKELSKLSRDKKADSLADLFEDYDGEEKPELVEL